MRYWMIRKNCLSQKNRAAFTLVETLAAFVILSLTLSIVFAGMSRMLLEGRHALVVRECLRLAQNRIDSLTISEPLRWGEQSGRFENGFVWRQHVFHASVSKNLQGAWVEVKVSAPGPTPSVSVSLLTYKLVWQSP